MATKSTAKKSAQGKKATTKLVRKANDINLKANGAGYATKDSKGNVTYFKSSKDAGGYSDTTQSRSEMSAGNPMFTKDAGGNVINSNSLKPVTPINLPTPPPVNGLAGVLDQGNAALAGSMGGAYDPKSKQMTAPTGDELFKSYQAANASAFSEMTSAEDRLKEQQRMLRPKEKAVNSLTAQLNTITANRDAEMLGLEGQGRGVTESIIGGQQAQISREAAIQAMPIQAQLAVAQDDLDSARSYASQLFQAQSQDALAKYNYQKELNASIYNFLDSQEKARLAKTEKEQDRAFQVEQANRSTLKQLSMQAIENGQSALAAEIMKANPASDTFDVDFGDYVSRLRKPVAGGSAAGAPKVVSINGVDSVWNAQTGQFEAITVNGGVKPVKDAEIKDLSETWTAKNSAIALVEKLQNNIRENGTQNLFGKTSGERTGDTTNLLLAMKNLEKTGALDKGTIDVLEGTIPKSAFFATEAAQIAALESIKTTINGKVDEYVGSYRGTSAETDPRTQRIYKSTAAVNMADDDLMDIEALFSSAASSPESFY